MAPAVTAGAQIALLALAAVAPISSACLAIPAPKVSARFSHGRGDAGKQADDQSGRNAWPSPVELASSLSAASLSRPACAVRLMPPAR